MTENFFTTERRFNTVINKPVNYIVIGSDFCGYAFTNQILKNKDRKSRVLLLERGPFFLSHHFQALPLPYIDIVQGGLAQTFPWSTTAEFRYNQDLPQYNMGMVPFFGGRSALWSAWSPRPKERYEDLQGWPPAMQEKLTSPDFFKSAKGILNVTPTDQISVTSVYGRLQKQACKNLDKYKKDNPDKKINRVEFARLSFRRSNEYSSMYSKFSTQAPLLALIKKHSIHGPIAAHKDRLDVVTDCVVQKIQHTNGKATALETSLGLIPIQDNTKLILASGCYPATTLALNSFEPREGKPNPGDRVSAHIMSHVLARVPRSSFKDLGTFELGAIYVGGMSSAKLPVTANRLSGHNHLQYHIQVTIIADTNPCANEETRKTYTASFSKVTSKELNECKDHVVFVMAAVGEMDVSNPDNHFKLSKTRTSSPDLASNCELQLKSNEHDLELWKVMDERCADVVRGMAPDAKQIEFWDKKAGQWVTEMPRNRAEYTVHESSTMWMGETEDNSVVDQSNYRLWGTENVYVTGSSLWPTGASWNPTLTMCAMAEDLAGQLTLKE